MTKTRKIVKTTQKVMETIQKTTRAPKVTFSQTLNFLVIEIFRKKMLKT